jgi:UDP-N-acetylmuramoyl-L-alanyl-D-glutamate--2,6-diaminopimelate ligase
VSDLAKPEGFSATWISVRHGRQALALVARNFYGRPDTRLHLTGITGTNGKTTTAYLIDSVLRAAGFTTGLIGTVEYRIAGEKRVAVNTTPESLDLIEIFAEIERKGGTHVTMEVSSHALALGRVHGLEFHTAVFTNLTRDHLDFHGTMEDYFAAKRLLFEGAGARPPVASVINHEDEWARRVPVERTAMTYGLESGATLRAIDVTTGFSGVRFSVEYEGRRYPVESPLMGVVNVYNVLAAYGTGLTYGLHHDAIARGIAQCGSVPGRFERVDRGQPFLVAVDYAHTDDALKNLIGAARALSPKRIITVFGCGGDRDRAKRPLMGMAAAQHSDFVVLTSDNPRSEDPLSIINDALVGLRRFDTPHRIEPDRATAIRIALEEAKPGDAVLIAGKGHETYQVLGSGTIHFDDREVAAQALEQMGYETK